MHCVCSSAQLRLGGSEQKTAVMSVTNRCRLSVVRDMSGSTVGHFLLLLSELCLSALGLFGHWAKT